MNETMKGYILNADRTLSSCNFENKPWEREMWNDAGTIIETPAKIATGVMDLLEALGVVNDYSLGVTKTPEGYKYLLRPNRDDMTFGDLTATAKRVKSYISMT
jgi:hypothetical protein